MCLYMLCDVVSEIKQLITKNTIKKTKKQSDFKVLFVSYDMINLQCLLMYFFEFIKMLELHDHI